MLWRDVTRAADWFFRSRIDGRITLAQWPNLPLWLFGAAAGLRGVVRPGGWAADALETLAFASLTAWALDELVRGVNPWRRCLGLAVLAWQTLGLVRG